MNKEDFDAFIAIATDQKQARFDGKMDEAYRLLEQMASILNKYENSQVGKERTRYFYEYGMTLSVHGHPNAAALQFVASGETAQLLGDTLRLCVGRFRQALTLFLGIQKEAGETFEFFKAQKATWPTLADVPSEDQGFRTGSEFNLIKRMMETAFESGSPEFPQCLKDMLAHERMVEGLAGDSAPHVHLHAYSQALEALYQGRYEDAAAIYSVMLDINVPGLKEAPDIKNTELVKNFGDNQAEELARDYLFMGRALLKCEVADAESHALAVWKKGLELNPVKGNWRYLRDIEVELQTQG